RRAAVSSFGVSGTNAHIILEQAPTTAEATTHPLTVIDAPVVVWPLSAKSPQALATQAQRLAEHLHQHPDLSLAEVCYSLASTPTHFDHRGALAVSGVDVDAARRDLLEGLCALAQGRPHPTLTTTATLGATGTVTGNGTVDGSGMGKTVFMFGGQGSQH